MQSISGRVHICNCYKHQHYKPIEVRVYSKILLKSDFCFKSKIVHILTSNPKCNQSQSDRIGPQYKGKSKPLMGILTAKRATMFAPAPSPRHTTFFTLQHGQTMKHGTVVNIETNMKGSGKFFITFVHCMHYVNNHMRSISINWTFHCLKTLMHVKQS